MSDEENQEIEPTKAPKKLDPGFGRNLKIIGGAFAAIILLVVLVLFLKSGGGSAQDRPSNMQVSSPTTQQSGELTPAQEAMLRETQLREAEEAARRGVTYIPPDTNNTMQPVVQQPIGVQTSSTYANAAVAVSPDARLGEVDERRRAGLQRQLEQMIAGRSTSEGVRERVTTEDRSAVPSASPAGGQTTAGNSAADAALGSQGVVLVEGLSIAAAQLTSDLNVPAGRSVYASARINSGPAAGAFLIGTAQVVDESLEVSFKTMNLGGKTYAVDAIVLDQVTAANAIAGSVDRRLLQRYVLPVTLAVAQGFFTAKASVGSSAVVSGTAVSVTSPPSTTEQARAAGIAKGIEIAGASVQDIAKQPIVVSASKNTPVGLLFRTPVTEVKK